MRLDDVLVVPLVLGYLLGVAERPRVDVVALGHVDAAQGHGLAFLLAHNGKSVVKDVSDYGVSLVDGPEACVVVEKALFAFLNLEGIDRIYGHFYYCTFLVFASIEKCFKCAAAQACLLYLTGVCACAP